MSAAPSRRAAGRRLAALLVAGAVLSGCAGAQPHPRTGGTVQATGPADEQTATVVSVDGLRYDPSSVQARVGTLTLTHRNDSPVPHDLAFTDDGLGAIATVTAGQSRSTTLTFDTPGTYDFLCTFHPGQVGEVVVS